MTTTNITPAATDTGLLDADGAKWTGNITYSIPGGGALWANPYAQGEPTDGAYGTLDATEAANYAFVAGLWDSYITPSITLVTEQAAPGEIRVAFTNVVSRTTATTAAYAYEPPVGGTLPQSGDIWIDSRFKGDSFAQNTQDFQILLHETGHALGLKHPFEAPLLVPSQYENTTYTLMSYTAQDTAYTFSSPAPGSIAVNSTPTIDFTPMVLDILAIQDLYTADPNTGAGNTAYAYTDADTVGRRAIYDASGNDTLDISALSRGSHVDLTPGAYSDLDFYTLAQQEADLDITYTATAPGPVHDLIHNTLFNSAPPAYQWTNNFGIAFSTTIENVKGSTKTDTIIGNSVANIITSNGGGDTVTGAGGADIYRDTGSNLNGETVTDFINADTINVSDALALLLNLGFNTNTHVLSFALATAPLTTYSMTLNGTPTGTPQQVINPNGGVDITFGTAPPLPTLAINDVTLSEGNGATTNFTFTVTSSAAAPAGGITFDIATVDGTATAPSDYTAKSVTGLVIPVGQTSATFTVLVNGDTTPETNETFGVNLSNATNATIADGAGLGTINNDDVAPPTPTLAINDVTLSEGNGATTNFTFTVTSSAAAPAGGITFDIATVDGTATAPSDYTAKSVTGLLIPVGQTSATFTVLVNGDTTPETNETFGVNLSNATNATIADGAGLGTINNDDVAPPLPTLAINDVTLSEGNGATTNFTFTVTSSAAAPAGGITFDIATVDGTATSPSDYTAKSVTGLLIPVGQTSATFTVLVNGDTTPETNETFGVNLSNATNATIADGAGLGTINNDDVAPPTPTLAINDVTLSEGNGATTNFTFTVTSSAAAPAGGITFDIATADGTATAPSDYTAKSVTGLVIPVGQTSATFTVLVNGDTTPETNETFGVNLSNATNATIADGAGLGTINNDDVAPPTPTLAINDVTLSEGNGATTNFTFTVTSSAAAPAGGITFDIATVDGTATAPSDYTAKSVTGLLIPVGQTSATFTVLVNGDTTPETNETFGVNLSNATNATIADGAGLGTINNDDVAPPLPTLAINDVTLSEGNGATTNFTFTVTSSAAAPAGGITFDIATVDGTATSPSDYTAKSVTGLLIPVGQTSATFTVLVNGDTTPETNETFGVNLSNATNATIADGAGLGTINNDDVAPPTPTLAINDVTLSEGNGATTNFTFTVTSSAAAPAGGITFDIATADGTATSPSDYTAKSVTGLLIPVGQTSATFTVLVNGDTTPETNETFGVNLSNATNATIADGQGVGTITNDDTAPVLPTLSVSDATIVEGNNGTQTLMFTVLASAAAPAGGITFDIATLDGTATSPSDYVAKSTTGVQIAAGTTTATFGVTINGDTTVEPNETFTVNLSNARGATIADGQGVGTITNDDTAPNAAPVNTVPGAQIANEDTNLAIAGLATSDADGGAGTETTTLSVVHGTLTVVTAGGAAVSGSGTGSVTLTGTVAQINTTLAAANNVLYRGGLDYNGADTLTVLTNDGGNTGTGGAKTDTDTVAITVNAINDAPIITSNGGGDTVIILQPENLSAVTTVHATDVDSAALSYSIIGGTDQAAFTINSTSGALSFIKAPDFENPTDSDHTNSYVVQVRASDGSLTDSQTITVGVTNVNENVDNGFHGDFGSDHKADLLQLGSDGSLTLDQMNGASIATSTSLGKVGTDWHVDSVADFNGNGTTDVLWHSDTGTVAFWLMNGSQVVSNTSPGSVGTNWHVNGTGDFGGDGNADILWRSDTGALAMWQMNGGQIASNDGLGVVGTDWHVEQVADFGGDHKSDILWRSDTGTVAMWQMNGSQVTSNTGIGAVGNDWHIVGSGDFNGDGKNDILWRDDDGTIAMWEMNGSQIATNAGIGVVGADWHVDGTGDFNGDGKTDIVWRQADGTTALWTMDGTHIVSQQLITPIAADALAVHHYDLV